MQRKHCVRAYARAISKGGGTNGTAKQAPKSENTDGAARSVRGRSAAVRGRAETRAGFRAVLPACAPAVNSRKSRTGASLFEARPENEHRAQAPRAVTNQGFEGSKCY